MAIQTLVFFVEDKNMNLQSLKSNGTRSIIYCRSETGDSKELDYQKEKTLAYTETHGYSVSEIFMESGEMDSSTYHSLRLRAKYREFDILLVAELEVFGNSPIEITQEINYLVENGIKVLSLKDGELNGETLPVAFRKSFRLVK